MWSFIKKLLGLDKNKPRPRPPRSEPHAVKSSPPSAEKTIPAQEEAFPGPPFNPSDHEITPMELKKLLDDKKGITLIDVREDWEYETARIAGARLLPLGQLPYHLQDLDSNAEIIVYCHHGMRSMNAAQFLTLQGFKNVKSLRGGIDQWSLEVDPQVPRY